ncbi:MAG: thiamine pyrophosphate-dependent enzyme [Planctomycetota bacterium]
MLLLGNGAIARGLIEAGAEVVTAYPGTPSTEILEEVNRQKDDLGVDVTTQWAVNEKVAFDVALAASFCGKRAATAMKQVGLNVASDSLLSAAYTGVVGGFVVIVCDDPGPHSSQTEQDTRLFTLFSKVPVLDPSSPREAKEMAKLAFEISERHRVPVILRPTTRVCHARQPIVPEALSNGRRRARFRKDPARWAATPHFRFKLHGELNEKLEALREEFEASPLNVEEEGEGPLGIIAGGHAWAVVRDVLREEGLKASLLKIGTPFPLPLEKVRAFTERHERVLVLEEPDYAIEVQIADRAKIHGRLSGHVPRQGELTPEVVADLLGRGRPASPAPPGPPPRLCLGCGHRAAFLAIPSALKRAIYAGDIGCYTLGVNQRTLDTCLDMGASITLAEGFYHAHRRDKDPLPIVAVIGDSTFFHAGMPGLLNCVTNDARIVVVVLDNGTVAMTGAQPTPGETGADIERIARGIGVRFVETIDPYQVEDMVALVKKAHAFTKQSDGGVAVVVARRPCALLHPPTEHVPVEVLDELCIACDQCVRFLACPGLIKDEDTGKVHVDAVQCIECGQCLWSCPHGAIVPQQTERAE